MQAVEFASDWFVHKINSVSIDEVIRIAKVLWGVWFFRIKKIWDHKTVTPVTAMD